MTSKHPLFLKILLGILVEVNGVHLFTLFIQRVDDLEGAEDILVGEVPIGVHDI